MKHGVTGWVRNTYDGKVEVLLTGERAAVDVVIAVIRRGTRRSRIDSVKIRTVKVAPADAFRTRVTTLRPTLSRRVRRRVQIFRR